MLPAAARGEALVATDVNRRFADMLAASGAPLHIEHDEPAMLGSLFRIPLLHKP
jgi:hypothetical protein